MKLSVFIITKNEADRIGRIISSVRKISAEVLDEILVIDSGSVDETCKIADQLGCRVIFNSWKGYGPQKVFGENQCRNDWILNIDADEEISSELAREISKIFQSKIYENFWGFRVKIVNQFPLEKKPKKLAYFYNQFRLYNKQFAGFKDSSIHDSVILKNCLESQTKSSEKISQLKGIIYHQSFRSFSHWIEKINSYSDMQAEEGFRRGKCPSFLKVFLVPIVAFFKAYLIRRYFIYGFHGVMYSLIFSFSRLVKVIKTRELFQKSI